MRFGGWHGLLLALAYVCTPAFAMRPEVIIDPGGAPPEVLQSITVAVDAITRLAEDQDVREVSRLRRRALDAAQAALRTQGYYAAHVKLDVADNGPDQPEFWEITIDPQAQTHVRHLGLEYQGAISTRPYEDRRKELRDGWLLEPGRPFINEHWAGAKTGLLDAVKSRDFYFARYERTRAVVDPQAGQADLELTVDSGPPVQLGDLQIVGLKRVPESLIRRYVRYEPGQAYEQALLDDWQQALQSTTFFRGAFVTLNDGLFDDQDDAQDKNAQNAESRPGAVPAGEGGAGAAQAGDGQAGSAHGGLPPASGQPAGGEFAEVVIRPDPVRPTGNEPVRVPVRVRVTEAPARYFSGAIGADSDRGARVEGLYRQNVVFGWPVWIETGVGIDQKRQRAFFDVHLPPTMDGSVNSFGLLYDHSDIGGVETSRTGLGWKRSQTRQAAGSSRVEYEVRWGAQVAHDKTRISGYQKYEVPSWAATWNWLRRDVDAKYDPREGNLIEVGLGVGTTLDDGRAFYRSSLRGQQWWPVGERDVISVRAELGKVWAHTSRLPQDFSWRTGGARSIRGYHYQSIGLKRGNATIGAPVMGVVGIDYTHYFTDILGVNVFLDAGDAAESFSRFKWHLGYGAGLAVRTPAGPFYANLAWAQKDRRLRLQFALGIAF